MKMIEDWVSKGLTCSACGEKRSVKYEAENGKPMCNRCILLHNRKGNLSKGNLSKRFIFETPEGKRCNGKNGNCIALETEKTGWCKYFKEHLRWDEFTYAKCEECLKQD